MLNADLKELKDLKWYFDAQKLGGKTETELVDFMMDEVRAMWKGLDDPIGTIGKKHNLSAVEELINKLKRENIFKIK